MGFYGVVEYGRGADLEEVHTRIPENRKFSAGSIAYEIYVRVG
jgi:hypothetical protein